MRALLIGYYGHNNLGDDLMLFCLRRWLELEGVSDITVLSEYPEAMKRFDLPAVENVPLLGQWSLLYSWLHGRAAGVVRAMRGADLVIVGGGDLIRTDRGWRPFTYAAEKIWLARLLRKPVYILNAGVGEPNTGLQARVLRATVRMVRQIVVRDERSVRNCGDVKCMLAPDIVMELPAFLGPIQPEGGEDVVVSLCSNRTDGGSEMTERRLANLATALDGRARGGERVVLLPFSPADRALHSAVLERMACRENVENLKWTGDIRAVAARIAGARLVIGMRLHAAVCAVAFERPCLAIPYEEKVRQLADSAGLPTLEAADLDDPATLGAAIDKARLTRPKRPGAVWSTRRISLVAPGR